MKRFLHTLGPALVLLFATLVVLAVLVLGAVGGPSHGSGGCNRIPLVNGQPAYRCANTPAP
jgi:hypothetical protein